MECSISYLSFLRWPPPPPIPASPPPADPSHLQFPGLVPVTLEHSPHPSWYPPMNPPMPARTHARTPPYHATPSPSLSAVPIPKFLWMYLYICRLVPLPGARLSTTSPEARHRRSLRYIICTYTANGKRQLYIRLRHFERPIVSQHAHRSLSLDGGPCLSSVHIFASPLKL
ncbi:hypothetical protein HGRIS_010156 [Hohenbuehelia grisea]|uniref:Uncharacterized protein n=1 Tax=Hohenbuehelia grisea TaxID=104357 RepID=A0ABR3J3T6_9AGAR